MGPERGTGFEKGEETCGPPRTSRSRDRGPSTGPSQTTSSLSVYDADEGPKQTVTGPLLNTSTEIIMPPCPFRVPRDRDDLGFQGSPVRDEEPVTRRNETGGIRSGS